MWVSTLTSTSDSSDRQNAMLTLGISFHQLSNRRRVIFSYQVQPETEEHDVGFLVKTIDLFLSLQELDSFLLGHAMAGCATTGGGF